MIVLELHGLELHGRHGAEAREREQGQRFLFDVWIDAPESSLSDRLEKTVDYREVASTVRDVSDARAYVLLEALAAAVARELLVRFPVLNWARVRVRKPEVELDPPVEFTAAEFEAFRVEIE